MDWGKAKSIFIFVLIILNIFLLTAISLYKYDRGVSEETIKNTLQVLDSRGVRVLCDIPGYNRNMPSVLSENSGLDKVRIASGLLGSVSAESGIKDGQEIVNGSRRLTFNAGCGFVYTDDNPQGFQNSGGAWNAGDSAGLEKYAKKYLEGIGIDMSGFFADKIYKDAGGGNIITFIQKYKGFPVFDNKLELRFNEKGVTRIVAGYKKIKGLSQHTMPIMPAHQVLLKNYKTGASPVTGIVLGFKGFVRDEENVLESSDGPAWRITSQDGTVRYFKANDGEEIN